MKKLFLPIAIILMLALAACSDNTPTVVDELVDTAGDIAGDAAATAEAVAADITDGPDGEEGAMAACDPDAIELVAGFDAALHLLNNTGETLSFSWLDINQDPPSLSDRGQVENGGTFIQGTTPGHVFVANNADGMPVFEYVVTSDEKQCVVIESTDPIALTSVPTAPEAEPMVEDRWTGSTIISDGGAATDVTININGAETQSDASGNFDLSVPRADNGRYVINAEKDGYLPISQIHIGSAMEGLILELQPVETFMIDPAQPIDVADSSDTQIKIDENQLVDADGNAPAGDIMMNMYTYDLAEEEMVGDMSGINSDGEEVYMESAGAFYASFEDEDGAEYNLADGATAEISIPVEEERPDEVLTVWSYDPETGLWVEEGVATLEDGRYVAEVSHFSYWNFDWEKRNPACIKLDVDQGYLATNSPLQVRAVLQTNPVSVRDLSIAEATNVLINLPANTDVKFYMAPDYSNTFATINSETPWGGVGTPTFPYGACNGQIEITAESKPTTGTLQGKVVDIDSNEPLPGAQVCVQGTDHCAAAAYDGSYSLTDLNPTDHVFEVSETDYITAVQTITLAAGDIIPLDFALKVTNPILAVLPDEAVLRGGIFCIGGSPCSTTDAGTPMVGATFSFLDTSMNIAVPEYNLVAGQPVLAVQLSSLGNGIVEILVPKRSETELGKAANDLLLANQTIITAVGETNQPLQRDDQMEVVLTDPNSSNPPYTVNFYRGEGEARTLVATFTINNQQP